MPFLPEKSGCAFLNLIKTMDYKLFSKTYTSKVLFTAFFRVSTLRLPS